MNMMNLRGSLDIAKRAVDRCLMLAKLSENVGESNAVFLRGGGGDAATSRTKPDVRVIRKRNFPGAQFDRTLWQRIWSAFFPEIHHLSNSFSLSGNALPIATR